MKKPDEKLEKQLNDIGIFFEKETAFFMGGGKSRLGVKIVIDYPAGTTLKEIDSDIVIINRRGVKTRFSDFKVDSVEGEKVRLSMIASQDAIEELEVMRGTPKLYTAFIDLCWYAGNEKVDPAMIPACDTIPDVDAKAIDLGWILPSRFVDCLIDAMGKLNDAIFSGTLAESIVYGPYFVGPNDKSISI